MAEEYLSLSWNNHNSVFLKFMKEFQIKEKFCDATIVCNGKFFPAHRLVLSSCSDYFYEIFDNSSIVHPFIILKDLQPSVLEALLNYMYYGHVSVSKEIFPELIKAAEFLKIKGLAIPDEETTNDDEAFNVKTLKKSRRIASKKSRSQLKIQGKKNLSQKLKYGSEKPSPSFDSRIDDYEMIFDDEDLTEVVNDIDKAVKEVSLINSQTPLKEKKKRKGRPSTSIKRMKLEVPPVIENSLSYNSSYKVSSEYSKCVICNNVIKVTDFDTHIHEHFKEGKQITKKENSADDGKNKEISNVVPGTSDEVNATLKCTLCSYESDSKVAFTSHIESHSIEEVMMCLHCSFSSDYPLDIISHMSFEHKPTTSEVVDNTQEELPSNYHRFRQNGKEAYVCNLCGYVSNILNVLRKHTHRHESEKMYSCSLCKFKTVHPSMLLFHLTQIHFGDKTNEIYTCLNCHFLSIGHESIVQHSKIHQDNSDTQNQDNSDTQNQNLSI